MDKNSLKLVAPYETSDICFGLNRTSDEHSLTAFLQKFADPVLLNVLIPRMSDNEIITTLNFITEMMHDHLSDKEYHELFL